MTRNCGLLTDIEHIFQAARQSDDGQRWVQAGITSLDEVVRVTRD